jgi:DNA-binding IclR family transcriptional regulator
VNTLEKCVRILTLFGEGRPVLAVTEIARLLDLPKSTAYRYVSALKEYGLVEEDARSGGYRLGGKLLELAGTVRRHGLLEIALPVMERLSLETGETVILAGLHQTKGICLERVEGHHALRVSHERGAVFPLHAGTSGKVLLAYLPPAEQEPIIAEGLPRFSETTITDPRKLQAELERIRRQGYAESNGEVIPHTYGLGAPIFASNGRIQAALTVSAPVERLNEKGKKTMVRRIVDAAAEITKRLAVYDAK